MAQALEPKGPFGTALYDVLQTKRRPGGSRLPWGAKQLAEALGAAGVSVAAKTIRSWLKGEAYPGIDDAMAIAAVLEVECQQLWNRAVDPINLPQDGRTNGGSTAARLSQATRYLPEAGGKAKPQPPKRRQSGSK